MRKRVADLEYLLAIDSPLIWQPRKLVSWILTTVQLWRCREDFDSLLITGEQVERVEHVPGQQASTAVSQTPGSRQDSKTVKLGTFLERIKSSFYLARVKIGPARARLGTWKLGSGLAWHSVAQLKLG